MKPPQQTFDTAAFVRYRVRGTQEQITEVSGFLFDLAIAKARQARETRNPSCRVQLQHSGPVGEGAKQWAMSFLAPLDYERSITVYLRDTLGLQQE